MPIFAPLTKDFVDHLRDRVELLRFSPGAGDLPPGRSRRQLLSGPHRLRESFRGAARRRVWCSPIWRGAATSAKSPSSAAAPRTATCTALDHVEVVRIRGEDFQLMLDRFPDVRRGLEEVATERLAENRSRAEPDRAACPSTSSSPRA